MGYADQAGDIVKAVIILLVGGIVIVAILKAI